jgi:hypothetical protein
MPKGIAASRDPIAIANNHIAGSAYAPAASISPHPPRSVFARTLKLTQLSKWKAYCRKRRTSAEIS